MEKNEKKTDSRRWEKNLSAQSETSAFNPDEMISCEKCGRKGPPNRTKCIYCGENINLTEIQSNLTRLNLRKPEYWENGYNLIFSPNRHQFGKTDIREVADLLDLKVDFIEKVLESNEFLPVVRLESESDSEIIKERLLKKGFETYVISDEQLGLKMPVRRLRKIIFDEDKLKLLLFNTGETVEILRENLCLIAAGTIFEKKTETVEKHIKSKENKTLEIDVTAKDEKIIDLYSRNDLIGYRILMSGFDFSCLGSEMSFLAFENIEKIREKIKEFAPEAKAVENYNEIRYLLGEIWGIEEIKDSHELSKKGIGNFNLKKATIITNLSQFTKYSRLQRHLI